MNFITHCINGLKESGVHYAEDVCFVASEIKNLCSSRKDFFRISMVTGTVALRTFYSIALFSPSQWYSPLPLPEPIRTIYILACFRDAFCLAENVARMMQNKPHISPFFNSTWSGKLIDIAKTSIFAASDSLIQTTFGRRQNILSPV